jgi:hypothetical protein
VHDVFPKGFATKGNLPPVGLIERLFEVVHHYVVPVQATLG